MSARSHSKHRGETGVPPSPGRARQACPCAPDSSLAAQPGSGGDPGGLPSSRWAMLVSGGLIHLSQRRDRRPGAVGALSVSPKGLTSRLSPTCSPARPPGWAARVSQAWGSRLCVPLHSRQLLFLPDKQGGNHPVASPLQVLTGGIDHGYFTLTAVERYSKVLEPVLFCFVLGCANWSLFPSLGWLPGGL